MATPRPAVPRRAPGLDGLRGLAVLAVLAFHEKVSALPGGFLGVDVFFVLSGFLITDILATPWDRGGRLDLRGFWLRRARRLLPALMLVLVAVTAVVTVAEPGELPALRPALLAAVTYTSNWWQAMHRQSYFAGFGTPPPLQHLWSLAIEEQFYLVWPILVTVILGVFARRRARAAAAWIAAAASALAMAAGYLAGEGSSRLYYGTDTHAAALLAGAGLALCWPLRRLTGAPVARTRRLDLAGLAGISVLAVVMVHLSGRGGALYLGGMAVAAAAAAAVVAAAAAPGMLARIIGWAPLRWLGVRSYGIYLWHWPVIALAAAHDGGRYAAPWIRLAETTTAIGLAALSWRFVEAPVIRHGFGATIRSWWAGLARSMTAARRSPRRMLAAGLIPSTVLAVACTAGYGVLHPPGGESLQQQIAAGARVSSASRSRGQAPAPAAAAAPGPNTRGHTAGGHTGEGHTGEGHTGEGHTGEGHTGEGHTGEGHTGGGPGAGGQPAPGRTAPGRQGRGVTRGLGGHVTAIGDSVMLAAAPQLQAELPGIYIDARVGRQMSQGVTLVRQLAGRHVLRPIVIVGLGTNGAVTAAQIRALARAIGPARRLVLVSTYVPRPWQDEVNNVLAAAARRYRNVMLANWYTAIRDRTSLLWPDGVHPQPRGAALYARVLAAAATAAARAVG